MIPDSLSNLRKRLDDAIGAHGLSAMREAIARAAQPQIRLLAAESDDEADPAVGASRLGGDPDLPAHLDWPLSRDGKHLLFIAQLDLSALPAWSGSPLPRTGWLWAFAGGEFPRDAAILHWAGDVGQLRRRGMPGEAVTVLGDEMDVPYDVVPLGRPRVAIDLPRDGDEYVALERATGGENALRDGLSALLDEFAPDADRDAGAVVHLLDRMAFGGESPATEYAVTYGKRVGDDWLSFMEVFEAGSMNWSDSGSLIFLLRAAELSRGDFSNAYAIITSA